MGYKRQTDERDMQDRGERLDIKGHARNDKTQLHKAREQKKRKETNRNKQKRKEKNVTEQSQKEKDLKAK